MRFLRLMALILLVCLVLPMAVAQPALRAYQKAEGYQYVSFGSYPQGAAGEVAPILWRVLKIEDGLAYLMSDRVLDVQRVNGDQWNYQGWETSELYRWLNADFLAAAFDEAQQQALHEDDSLGKVSLVTAKDLKNREMGFGTDKSRWIYGTAYALEQRGLYSYSGRGHSPIWLRDRSSKKHAQLATKSSGEVGFIGVESDDLGVCPVIWLKLDAIQAKGGDGSLAAPLILVPQPGDAP